MRNKAKKLLSPLYSIEIIFLWSSKILFCISLEVYFFYIVHIYNIVSTFPSVLKIDAENDNVVSTLSNVVQIKIETDNVESKLFNVLNSNIGEHNVVSKWIWRCVMSRRHINLKTTLKQDWMFAGTHRFTDRPITDQSTDRPNNCIWKT